ncbi:hypothetical protein Tsp_02155 [Trichinella spiralis]|uniref:hypothetical protein n=1 Tax=Trichinella spiralis TaxID=6334 RepID=UPI0001EFC4A2|nr:hypothetical protein Tsp_02155 [Trichinella spiralis]
MYIYKYVYKNADAFEIYFASLVLTMKFYKKIVEFDFWRIDELSTFGTTSSASWIFSEADQPTPPGRSIQVPNVKPIVESILYHHNMMSTQCLENLLAHFADLWHKITDEENFAS